ncbi:MAG: hypothetical protein EHM87_22360 [Burkholderiales bacterium]|nr:MAG: hypothetical protein EHM87_22360 [Burkholderiales bacterium]
MIIPALFVFGLILLLPIGVCCIAFEIKIRFKPLDKTSFKKIINLLKDSKNLSIRSNTIGFDTTNSYFIWNEGNVGSLTISYDPRINSIDPKFNTIQLFIFRHYYRKVIRHIKHKEKIKKNFEKNYELNSLLSIIPDIKIETKRTSGELSLVSEKECKSVKGNLSIVNMKL